MLCVSLDIKRIRRMRLVVWEIPKCVGNRVKQAFLGFLFTTTTTAAAAAATTTTITAATTFTILILLITLLLLLLFPY